MAQSRASNTEVREAPRVTAAGALGSWTSLGLRYEGNINLKRRKGYEVGLSHRKKAEIIDQNRNIKS